MARTFVQQSQISGSLAFNDVMGTGAAELASKQTLVGDLDALRSQINKIVGGERWYDALSGSQNLADIYAALQVNGPDAAFQGDISAVGDVSAVNATLSGDLGAVNATLSGDLGAVNATLSGDLGAVNATLSGDLGAVNATLSGDLGAVNGSFSGNIDAVDASFSGAMDVGGIADFAADAYMAADLYVSGAMEVAQGLTVTGDRLEVTGSMGITGAVDFDSTLNVDGVADFKADVYMAAALGVSGSASVAGALDAGSLEVAGLSDLNGALEVAGVADFASDVYMAAALGVSGSLTVAQDIGAVNVTLSGDLSAVSGSFSGDLDVDGDLTAYKISIDGDVAQHLYIVDSDGSIKDEANLWFDGSKLYVSGALELSDDLEVKGGDITMSNGVALASSAADTLVITADEAVELTGKLKVGGNEIKSSTGDTVVMLSGKDAFFKNDVHVAGDLYVTGTMTYIETENLKVKDSIIHLSTGSNTAASRGLVFHGGAGVGGDIAMGAAALGFDFIFAKEVDDSDVDAGNSEIFASAKLAAAWMSELKLGGIEGSLSGSFAATAAGAELSSSAALTVAAGASDALTLGAFNKEIDLMQAAEKDDFDGKFTATSVVGALVELFDMIGGGSAAKGDLSVANVSTNTLTFSSIGTLTAAEHKLVDVYLNGVLLSPSRDLSGLTTTTVDLDSAIAGGLMADDVITVVIRSAA